MKRLFSSFELQRCITSSGFVSGSMEVLSALAGGYDTHYTPPNNPIISDVQR